MIKKVDEIANTISILITFTRDYKDIGARPPTWITIADIVGSVRKTVNPERISIHIADGMYTIFADPLIEKVFYNLVDNSLQHGERVTEIRIGTREKDGRLIIWYEDNGIGIPNEEKESIFERETGMNTGLGLFLAREILAITGITIIENGEPGEGARFEMTVPEGSFSVADQKQIGLKRPKKTRTSKT